MPPMADCWCSTVQMDLSSKGIFALSSPQLCRCRCFWCHRQSRTGQHHASAAWDSLSAHGLSLSQSNAARNAGNMDLPDSPLLQANPARITIPTQNPMKKRRNSTSRHRLFSAIRYMHSHGLSLLNLTLIGAAKVTLA